MRTWLSNCFQTHSLTCGNEKAGNPWYPTRLLCINISSTSVEVRLQECKLQKPCGNYLTLSHRWGASVPLQLTSQNLQQLKAGIPLDTLPITFQQAINVTAKLECKYLMD